MWIVFSLLCAVMVATRDSLTKLLTQNGINVTFLMIIVWSATGIFSLLVYALTTPIDLSVFLKPESLILLSILLPLEGVASAFYFLALSKGQLSLTLPFLTFTPALIPLTAYLIMSETIAPIAFVGIGFTVAGSYILFWETDRKLLDPFRKMFKEPGSIMMLITAIIYSVTSVLGRKLTLEVGSVNMSAFYPLSSGIVSILVALILSRPKVESISLKTGLLLGGIVVVSIAALSFHFIAIQSVQTAYMITLKRSSALFSLVFAFLLFREKNLGKRAFGIALMLIGIGVVAIFVKPDL